MIPVKVGKKTVSAPPPFLDLFDIWEEKMKKVKTWKEVKQKENESGRYQKNLKHLTKIKALRKNMKVYEKS